MKRKIPSNMLSVITALLLVVPFSYAHGEEEVPVIESVEQLLDLLLEGDPAESAFAENYIQTNLPDTVPDFLADIIINEKQPEVETAIRVIQYYPVQSIFPVWFRILEKSRSPQRQIEVIGLLLKTNSKSIVVPLAEQLGNPDADVRAEAIRALAVMGDDRVYPVIFELTGRREPVYRLYAVEALITLYDMRFADTVGVLLNDENKSVRLMTMRCIRAHRLDRYMGTVRNLALQDSSPEVRVEALLTMQYFNDGAVQVYLQALSNADVEVRKTAARILLPKNFFTSADYASNQLLVEQVPEVKELLLEIMYSSRAGGNYAGLRQVLNNDPLPSMRIRAAVVLGRCYHAMALDVLVSGMGNEDSRVRAEIYNSLGLLNFGNSYQYLLNALAAEKDVFARQAALFSLERLRIPFIAEQLKGIYRTEKDPVFSRVMLMSLQRMGITP